MCDLGNNVSEESWESDTSLENDMKWPQQKAWHAKKLPQCRPVSSSRKTLKMNGTGDPMQFRTVGAIGVGQNGAGVTG